MQASEEPRPSTRRELTHRYRPLGLWHAVPGLGAGVDLSQDLPVFGSQAPAKTWRYEYPPRKGHTPTRRYGPLRHLDDAACYAGRRRRSARQRATDVGACARRTTTLGEFKAERKLAFETVQRLRRSAWISDSKGQWNGSWRLRITVNPAWERPLYAHTDFGERIDSTIGASRERRGIRGANVIAPAENRCTTALRWLKTSRGSASRPVGRQS